MKAFVSFLLLIYLFWALLLAWIYWTRRPVTGNRRSQAAYGASLVLAGLLYLPSTPIGSSWLHAALTRRVADWAPSSDFEPKWIVVLAGGFARGATPEEDVLTHESALRTAHAVTLAERYTHAGVIFAGGMSRTDSDRGADRLVTLMQSLATGRGLAEERTRLEIESLNTRQHPDGVLALDGVSPDDAILVVTSDWHLPRARSCFDSSFTQTAYSGSSHQPSQHPGWRRVLPEEESLIASTLYLRECVGRIWYFLSGK